MGYIYTIVCALWLLNSFLIIILDLKGTLRDLTKAGRAITYDQNEAVCNLVVLELCMLLLLLILVGKFYLMIVFVPPSLNLLFSDSILQILLY